MRRRLTVTGASQDIDGVSKVDPAQEIQEQQKKPKKKNKVSRRFCFPLC
jgi:hypothetical protein